MVIEREADERFKVLIENSGNLIKSFFFMIPLKCVLDFYGNPLN